MTPAWIKLLEHQRRRKRLALSIPFVVGALQEPVGRLPATEVEAYRSMLSLLTQFRAEAREFDTVSIRTCSDLQQPVVSLSTSYWQPGYEAWGVVRPEGKRLHIDPPFQPADPDDMDAAARLLWPVVARAIVAGHFSYMRSLKCYRSFDNDDRQFITEALDFDEENQL